MEIKKYPANWRIFKNNNSISIETEDAYISDIEDIDYIVNEKLKDLKLTTKEKKEIKEELVFMVEHRYPFTIIN